ncbi:hypothetical protein, partial [Plastoroseomonas hellenica]|uniref:hypothetical protein n=1 Tax=Plastoroseomonas hellenica TaxID=2687306 RepID=UPI001BAC686B
MRHARGWLFGTTALVGASPDRGPSARSRLLPMGALAAALLLPLAGSVLAADGGGGGGGGGCGGPGGGGGGGG